MSTGTLSNSTRQLPNVTRLRTVITNYSHLEVSALQEMPNFNSTAFVRPVPFKPTPPPPWIWAIVGMLWIKVKNQE